MSPQLDLVANIWEDELTLNQYSIIQLDNEYQSQTLLFEEYLMSTKGEAIIAEYTINGQQMFNLGQPNQEPSSSA